MFFSITIESRIFIYPPCRCQVASVVSDSVQPHRWQPTRLPHPWDSPGKNTGVGCHFLLQCMKVKSEREVAQSCPTLSDPMDCSLPGSSVHGIFQARVLEWGAIAFSNSEPSLCQMQRPYIIIVSSQQNPYSKEIRLRVSRRRKHGIRGLGTRDWKLASRVLGRRKGRTSGAETRQIFA